MPALPPDVLPSSEQGGAVFGTDLAITSVFGYEIDGEPIVHVDYGNDHNQLQDYTPSEFLTFLTSGYRALLHSLSEVYGPQDVLKQMGEWVASAEDVTRSALGHLLVDANDEPRDFVPAV